MEEEGLREAFSNTFMDLFFPKVLRETKMKKFVNLRQGRMSRKEYSLKFHQLLMYATNLVADMRLRIRKFTSGLNRDLIHESKTSLLIKDMDISRLIVNMQ